MRTLLSARQKTEIHRLILDYLSKECNDDIPEFIKKTDIASATARRVLASSPLKYFPNSSTFRKLKKAIPEIEEIQKDIDIPTINELSFAELDTSLGGNDMAIAEELVAMIRESVSGRMSAMEANTDARLRAIEERLGALSQSMLAVEQSSSQRYENSTGRISHMEDRLTYLTKKLLDDDNFPGGGGGNKKKE